MIWRSLPPPDSALNSFSGIETYTQNPPSFRSLRARLSSRFPARLCGLGFRLRTAGIVVSSKFEDCTNFGLQRTNYSRDLGLAERVFLGLVSPALVLRISMHYHSPLATILGPVHDGNDH